jgi:hypothetical protein
LVKVHILSSFTHSVLVSSIEKFCAFTISAFFSFDLQIT